MSQSSLLWSLQPPSGRQSWLFGTMHIRDQRAYQLCDSLYPLISQADVYVGEMDLAFGHRQPDPPVYNMEQYFSRKGYEKLKKQLLRSFDFNLDTFSHLHPLLVMSAIMQKLLQQDHAISLDEHLWQFAREHDLITTGLESVDEQVSLLHSIDSAPLYAEIRDIGRRPWQIRRHTRKTLDAYMQQEVHTLYRLTKSSMQHLRKRIIYERNIVMTKRIIRMDMDKQYFISVGAGHLSGPTGLISSLRKQQWLVKPVVY